MAQIDTSIAVHVGAALAELHTILYAVSNSISDAPSSFPFLPELTHPLCCLPRFAVLSSISCMYMPFLSHFDPVVVKSP
jgi:hypothetical protein